MVEHAEHATGHVHDGGEQHVDGGRLAAQQAELDEQEAHHRHREHFEEAFHPQVHHPPAPVVDHRHVGLLAPHQAGAVEQGDRDGRQEQQADDRRHLVLALERRPQGAAHQQQPQQQADEQEGLPETADVDVFPALVAEPEVVLQVHLLHHREPLADERADHDDQQADEQEVDAGALVLGFMPGHRRADVQAGGQPRGGDPQHRQLRVPAAGQRVGQDLGDLQAVGFLAFHLVVRGGRAQQDLGQEQRHHHPEILGGGLHRRGDGQALQRIPRRRRRQRFLAVVGRVMPGQQADAADQEQDREHRPDEVVRGRLVADQRLIRPVVGIGAVFVVGPVGAGGPRGPEEERGHRPAVARIRDGVVLHRIGFAQVAGGRVVGEHALVVGGHHADRLRTHVADHDLVLRRIEGVGANQRLDRGLEPGLLAFVEAGVGLAGRVARLQFQHRLGFAMQPVGRPVGGDQGAVTPDGAQLLAADALPDLLAFLDVVPGVQHLAAAGDDACGYRWLGLDQFRAKPQHDGETGDEQGGKAEP